MLCISCLVSGATSPRDPISSVTSCGFHSRGSAFMSSSEYLKRFAALLFSTVERHFHPAAFAFMAHLSSSVVKVSSDSASHTQDNSTTTTLATSPSFSLTSKMSGRRVVLTRSRRTSAGNAVQLLCCQRRRRHASFPLQLSGMYLAVPAVHRHAATYIVAETSHTH